MLDKKTGTIFRDPAARMHVGRHDYHLALPVPPEPTTASATSDAIVSRSRFLLPPAFPFH